VTKINDSMFEVTFENSDKATYEIDFSQLN
jgi:hypothetical protein